MLGATVPGFRQEIAIDTSRNFLETTPQYSEEEALREYQELEIDLVNKRNVDLKRHFYLLFRYRDPFFRDIFEKAADNSDNPILKIGAYHALQQIEGESNPRIFKALSGSENPIFREMAANAFSRFGKLSDTLYLKAWAAREANAYVVETLKAGIKVLKSGGYKNRFPYLPQYYATEIRKLKFFFNMSVESKSGFAKEFLLESSGPAVAKSDHLAFPHQQFLHSIKNAPRKNFGNKHGRKYHTGEDSGWFLEGLPIHSIGNGIVRKITHETSWGVFVAIETRLPNDSTTMVYYGHLAKDLNVDAGDVVYTGQKIGELGSSVSYENGGYWPHLHLGIERVPFKKASFLGYDTAIGVWSDPATLIGSYLQPM